MSPATLNHSRSLSGDRPVIAPLLAGLCMVVLFLCVSPTVFPAAGDPDQTDQDEQAELAKDINDLMRQERRNEALPLCRAFTDRFPDDPVMFYNLACLENTTGDPEKAVAAFSKAVAAGFDDFETASGDPDLAGLEDHPTMVRLARDHGLKLSQLAVAMAVNLSWREISPPVRMMTDHPDRDSAKPEIRLTWSPMGLDIELRAPGPWADLVGPDNLAPWNGGGGLVITLGIPDPSSTGPYQTSNHFLFAFGLEKGTSHGAVYLAGQDRWQTISELVPKIRLDDTDNLELRTTIPWTSILPYNPLVDDQLGFNATLRRIGPGAPQQADLLSDPAAFRPRSAVRRVVPLTFQTGSVDHEIFSGKVTNTISGSEPVTFELTVISPEEGAGLLTIDFLGGPEQSLLPDGQVSGTLDLAPGLNRLTRQADFTALKTGPYLIKAEMTFPSGRSLAWGSAVLQLGPDWQREYHDRIDLLKPQEKSTALYFLESIEQAVATHPPRRSPGAILTTLSELDLLLDNAEKGGSILPDKGPILAVYPGPEGDNRLCHIYLPSGWKIATRLNPVLTLTVTPGMDNAIAGRLGLNYEQEDHLPTFKAGSDVGFPVYLVPRLIPPGGRRPGDPPPDPVAEAKACLAWAKDTFNTETASVASMNQSAGTALSLAGTRPGTMKAMIIFAGSGLDPWPQADLDFIKQKLVDFPADLPITWADFVLETNAAGQGPLILRALKELEKNVVEVQEVRGGLNFTQIADRTVLWAEGLR